MATNPFYFKGNTLTFEFPDNETAIAFKHWLMEDGEQSMLNDPKLENLSLQYFLGDEIEVSADD